MIQTVQEITLFHQHEHASKVYGLFSEYYTAKNNTHNNQKQDIHHTMILKTHILMLCLNF